MVDVQSAVSTVFCLEELRYKMSSRTWWHRADKAYALRRELEYTVKQELEPLARAFRDYITLTVAAEVRHAKYNCCQYWEDYPTSHNFNRYQVFDYVKRYEPRSLLQASVHLLSMWDKYGYGGPPWLRIAEAGMMYYSTNPMLFLDHVVDLSHNNGLFLDKGTIFDYPESRYDYIAMLTRKTTGSLLEPGYGISLHEPVCDVVQDSSRLLGIQIARVHVKRVATPLWDSYLVTWGGEKFEPTLLENEKYNYSEEGNDEMEEEEENEHDHESCMVTDSAR